MLCFPSQQVYIAQLNPNRPLHPDAEQQFALGVLLENGKRCQPAKLERIAQDPPTVRITLAEGMYHQVKRMIKQVGSYVVKLHREQIVLQLTDIAAEQDLSSFLMIFFRVRLDL
eukprot:TRINITY_DN9586_c0_g1_i2.p2 TRINITY_DN9586_c0_g1~~TRINITY_DN9586_c0_g1_i2.p2  ORF type:complete len:114 (+),score=23.34 TRINITY_DN9586_c0_g1_i2:975-1316(+)